MKKKIFRVLNVFLIMIGIPTFSLANGYIPNVGTPSAPSTEFNNVAGNIIGVMMWVGYAIAVGMIIFIGIKYVIASADEKASLKGVLVKVIIGSLIIAGSVTIANIVKSVFSS